MIPRCVGNEVTFSANVSAEYDRVQRLQMGGLLENLASMGYLTRAGIYVTQALLQSAESATSRSLLDDYRRAAPVTFVFVQITLSFLVPALASMPLARPENLENTLLSQEL